MQARSLLVATSLAAFAAPLHAAVITYTANLSGPAESPPNISPGVGTSIVDWDDVALTMRVRTNFSGLLAGTTASHIHAATTTPGTGTAGVATQTPSFSGFPLGVTSGSMDTTFDMTLASSYNPAFVTANGGTVPTAMTALKAALDSGRAYLNIHSSQFGGGEIRGFLAVPSPGGLALIGLGMLAARRRR